jgi:hypothetical protein
LPKRKKTSNIVCVVEDFTMSRTYRKTEGMHSGALRFPHTFNEIKQLDGLLHEEDLEDLPVSGLNHIRAREHKLPTAWDDRVVSAYYQEDYKAS